MTTLREELQQTRPFGSPAHEAMLSVARTASLIERTTAKLLAPHGLSTAQYNVLRILRGAGAAGLPTLTIRERLIDPAAAITRLVDKLERAGFIARERDAADRRQVTCVITAAGLAVLEQLDPALQDLYAAIDQTPLVADLSTLTGILDQMRALLRGVTPPR